MVGEAVAVLIPVDVAPALHRYDVPPPPVKVAVSPAQIVGEFTVTFGSGATVMMRVQELLVPLLLMTVSLAT